MLYPQSASPYLLAFGSAVLGALLGAATRWSAARRERRLRMTLELYAEFHSPAFNHIRILAHAALSSGEGVPVVYNAAQGETREAISSVVHYWEKVAILAQMNAVQSGFIKRALGQYARWWSPLLCEPAAAREDAEWGASLRDIHALFEKLKRTKREGARR